MLTCKIRWIDCQGDPTPHDAPAVALAVCSTSPREAIPICAEHLATMRKFPRVRHHDPNCRHPSRLLPSFAEVLWHEEPLSTKDGVTI